MDQKELSFEDWQKIVHESIRSEKFWSLIAYQKALYLYNLLWNDSERWLKDPRGQILSKQITGSSDQSAQISKKALDVDLENSLSNSMFTLWALPAKRKVASTARRYSTQQKS